MRLPNPTAAESAPCSNKFGSFSCPTGGDQKESTLMPSKAVQKDLKAMPKSNKRRIIMSDDEEGTPQRRTPNGARNKPAEGTPSSTDWVDSRKVSNMTQQERERNVQVAIEQRKQHGINVKGVKAIAKAPRVKYADDQGSDDDVLHIETPIADANALKRALSAKPSGKFKSSLLNETFNEDEEDALEQVRQKRLKEEGDLRAQRAENRTFGGRTFSSTPQATALAFLATKAVENGSGSGAQLKDIFAKGKSQLEAIDLEDSDDDVVVVRKPAQSRRDRDRDEPPPKRREREVVEVAESENEGNASDSEEGGYQSDMDRGAVQALANKVLQQCDALSRNLRHSLVQWETGGDTSAAAAGRDCVDLTSIRAPASSTSGSAGSAGDMKQILYDEDIEKLCPELRLKGYQLVGVNWLKLLHLNNVNGVLADDMGLGKRYLLPYFCAYKCVTAVHC
jgi:SNF2 family DNA or RNA helicase